MPTGFVYFGRLTNVVTVNLEPYFAGRACIMPRLSNGDHGEKK
jgi:hypothetical protein